MYKYHLRLTGTKKGCSKEDYLGTTGLALTYEDAVVRMLEFYTLYIREFKNRDNVEIYEEIKGDNK